LLSGDPEVEIAQLEYDSRAIKSDALFIAIKGYAQDGFDFVEQAGEAGAVAVMGERDNCDAVDNYVRVPNVRKAMADVSAKFYGFPGYKLKAIGVTGTNGKTTTCYLLRCILEARNKKVGLITSQEYYTGKETFSAERTTPESLDMQRLLYLMKGNYCMNAIIEVSSHGLVLHRVDNIDFRVAVYTNLTRDHLDFHKSMEEYFQAKKQLAMRLEGPLSYAVINLDVDEFRPLLGEISSSYMTYSLEDDKADVYCASRKLEPEQTTFDLVTPMGAGIVRLRLPGKFNLQNALAAAAGGLAGGVDLDNVIKGLERANPVAGRLSTVKCGQPFAVFVDFAHTPDAIIRLCETVRELTDGRLLLLFGCGGDRDKGKRPLMGKAAMEYADYSVVTTDNPRSEEPEAIIEDIKLVLDSAKCEIRIDRKEAIAAIMKKATPGDAVILAGKGAEPYQEIKGERIPFSDTAEAELALANLGYRQKATDEET